MSRPPKLKVRGAVCCSAFQLPDLGFKNRCGGVPQRTWKTKTMEVAMTECTALAGKVIQRCSLSPDGPYGPEVLIEFTDGTVFNTCLKTSANLEAKLLRKSDDEAELVKDFSPTLQTPMSIA